MFFTTTSLLMLAGVLAGFAPSFFLRPAYFDSSLPTLLVIHGIVMTAWFVALALQAYLAQMRRFAWHRPLGWVSVGVAVLVVITSPPVIVRSVPNGLSQGLPGFAVSFIFMTGMLRVVFFATMVGVAIRWRRQRTVHTRALFLASLSNFAPATSRIATMMGMNVVVMAFLYLIPFGIAAVMHDRQTLRRTHALTACGLAATVLILLIPIGLLFAGATGVIVAAVH